jgi:hypothetical protein
MTEKKEDKTVKKYPCVLEKINNNIGLLYANKIKEPGNYQVGLEIEMENPQLKSKDSRFTLFHFCCR